MITALIVAGGKGLRMKNAVRKQYMTIGGRPVLSRTLNAFESCDLIDRVVLVIPEADHGYCKKEVLGFRISDKPVLLVSGGSERQESVFNGLTAVSHASDDIIVIHDGVRPFVENSHIILCIETAKKIGAAILALPVFDTIKKSDSGSCIEHTVDRSEFWLAQTPQVFKYNIIQSAHSLARASGFSGTDDASLVERMGRKVKLLEGSRMNIKITTPEDILIAESFHRTLQ